MFTCSIYMIQDATFHSAVALHVLPIMSSATAGGLRKAACQTPRRRQRRKWSAAQSNFHQHMSSQHCSNCVQSWKTKQKPKVGGATIFMEGPTYLHRQRTQLLLYRKGPEIHFCFSSLICNIHMGQDHEECHKHHWGRKGVSVSPTLFSILNNMFIRSISTWYSRPHIVTNKTAYAGLGLGLSGTRVRPWV